MWVQAPPAVLYNTNMKIIVEPDGFNYVGYLYINDEKIATHKDIRPGCCVRALMNQILLKFGKPTNTINVDITGWQ